MDDPKIKGPLSLRRERDRERESTCVPVPLRRQVVIEPCIVDFACLEGGSIIDGGQHSDQLACDARRTMQLEGMGCRVMPPHPVPLPREREPGLKPPHPIALPRERELECTANPQIFPRSQGYELYLACLIPDTSRGVFVARLCGK
jgi:hypothetical protein